LDQHPDPKKQKSHPLNCLNPKQNQSIKAQLDLIKPRLAAKIKGFLKTETLKIIEL
jgi:hypothetical protein